MGLYQPGTVVMYATTTNGGVFGDGTTVYTAWVCFLCNGRVSGWEARLQRHHRSCAGFLRQLLSQ